MIEQEERILVARKQLCLPSDLVRDDVNGHYSLSRAGLLLKNERRSTWRRDVLDWLREHVHPGIPRAYYRAVLGHDLHVSSWATLHVRHFHYGQRDPFTGKLEFSQQVYWHHINNGLLPEEARKLAHGWWENVGLVSQGKVTTAFRDFEIDQLIAESAAYGDFKFHRPGTGSTAEANTQTELTTDAGLEATGTQVEAAADQYRSVATVTADVTETWAEHSIRNATGATGGTMMDRSLISPTVAVVASDTVEFTYTLTKNAEA